MGRLAFEVRGQKGGGKLLLFVCGRGIFDCDDAFARHGDGSARENAHVRVVKAQDAALVFRGFGLGFFFVWACPVPLFAVASQAVVQRDDIFAYGFLAVLVGRMPARTESRWCSAAHALVCKANDILDIQLHGFPPMVLRFWEGAHAARAWSMGAARLRARVGRRC